MENPVIPARIYISGQISGLDRSQYMERFSEAERLLHESGYSDIVNPTRVWVCRFPWLYRAMKKLLGSQTLYSLILLYDLFLLMRCQRIYKVPGWKLSCGAQIESAVAYNFNLYTVIRDNRERIDRELEKIIKRQEADELRAVQQSKNEQP